MNDDARDDITEEDFLKAVSALSSEEPAFSPLAAAILAALHFGIAKDSRTFSRKFDIAHALVLREVSALADDLALLVVTARNQKNQRTEFAPAEKALQLFARALK
ncbi:hypothetical protein [Hyphomicrobium sp.]|uniref:hypothetical protein n=1 Tax=Hyphomicrobium sp. TaxID=82 RepID=UPI002D788E25|nr:hypothetical protein [Hyphomicrobium sp.]HET6388437.1 hypothetical protein [Hyphomicrobium sp.]